MMSSLNVVLTSQSKIKLAALTRCLPSANVVCIPVDADSPAGQWNAEQPVGKNGLLCAKLRITHGGVQSRMKGMLGGRSPDYIISVENSIRRYLDADRGFMTVCEDVVNVVIYDTVRNVYHAHVGGATPFAQKYWDEAAAYPTLTGFTRTVGQAMVMDPDCPAQNEKNWMEDVAERGREDQIFEVLRKCLTTVMKAKNTGIHELRGDGLRANVNYVPDFPKAGVMFQDISPLLRHPEELWIQIVLACMRNKIDPFNVDYIVGLDARGFIVGGMMAAKWNRPFVMARKPGKLPGNNVVVDYGLEYGTNRLQMQPDAFDGTENPRVLIVDDLFATGGSMCAAIELVGKTNNPPKVVGCLALLAVDNLLWTGKRKLADAGCDNLIVVL